MDIHGWVEVTSLDPHHRSESYAWTGVIRLDYLIGWYDIVAAAMFRFRPATSLGGEPDLPAPIAADRGIPPNSSENVAAELEAIRDFEARSGAGEFGEYTHVTWEELQAVDW